jgi:hypothetical protein
VTDKKKPAPDGNRETGYDAAFDSRNLTAIRSRFKSLIVRLALWGLIPAGLASWLIQRGGLRHD